MEPSLVLGLLRDAESLRWSRAPERKAVHFFSVGWHFVGFNTAGGAKPIISGPQISQ